MNLVAFACEPSLLSQYNLSLYYYRDSSTCSTIHHDKKSLSLSLARQQEEEAQGSWGDEVLPAAEHQLRQKS